MGPQHGVGRPARLNEDQTFQEHNGFLFGCGRRTSRSSRLRRQFGMNEIMITGSTGVIGRRAVRELIAAG